MKSQQTYHTTIKWTGNSGQGTSDYHAYDRSYTATVEGKPDILCSSDPAFRGDKTKHNPEELFLASLSSCHMLWYLHLCADAGVVVVSYTDKAMGLLDEGERGHFTEVTLHPSVVVKNVSMVTMALALHKEANQKCFIANSCNFPIRHKPTCVTQNSMNRIT